MMKTSNPIHGQKEQQTPTLQPMHLTLQLPCTQTTKRNPPQRQLPCQFGSPPSSTESVRKPVYAICHNQSNTTFVTEAVCEALHLESEPVRLKLTTITEEESDITCQRISSLRVIDIRSAYTRETIPADSMQIPTNGTAKNWSHLRSINKIPPLQDCEVGLLIGYKCSQALVPQEVVTGQDDEPFAVCMDLDWSIAGRASSSASCLNILGICNHTSARESLS